MPKIQFKTITQQAFELDFDDNATVSYSYFNCTYLKNL
jgi:hypothetical protein